MGSIFTEAVIQQLADIDRDMLRVLKDFTHLLHDNAEKQSDGLYHWDVPQTKLAAMSNINPRTVRNNLKKLAAKKILVRVKKGSNYNDQASEYALNLPKGLDKQQILDNYGKVFAGQTYQAAMERILRGNRRGIVLAEMKEADFSQPETVSMQEETISNQEETISTKTETISAYQHNKHSYKHSTTSTPSAKEELGEREKEELVEGEKSIFNDDDNRNLSVDVLVSRACAICRDFNGSTLRTMNIPKAFLSYVRDAIDVFAKMSKESMKNPAKYLYTMCQNAAKGKAPIPNDKITEEVAQLECDRQQKVERVLSILGLDNKSLISAGESGISVKQKTLPLLMQRINRIVDQATMDELESICREAIDASQKALGTENCSFSIRALSIASQFGLISSRQYQSNV